MSSKLSTKVDKLAQAVGIKARQDNSKIDTHPFLATLPGGVLAKLEEIAGRSLIDRLEMSSEDENFIAAQADQYDEFMKAGDVGILKMRRAGNNPPAIRMLENVLKAARLIDAMPEPRRLKLSFTEEWLAWQGSLAKYRAKQGCNLAVNAGSQSRIGKSISSSEKVSSILQNPRIKHEVMDDGSIRLHYNLSGLEPEMTCCDEMVDLDEFRRIPDYRYAKKIMRL